MTIDMSQFYQVFFEEADEHLATMESLLLDLDVGAPESEDLHAIFRAAHSIKGGSATFGFSDMAEVTHVLETLLDRLRNGEETLTAPMVDAFLQAVDVLRSQLTAHQNGEVAEDTAAVEVRRVLREFIDHRSAAVAAPAPGASPTAPTAAGWQVVYRPVSGESGAIDGLVEELSRLGEVDHREIAPGTYEFRVRTGVDDQQLRDIFDFVAQPEELSVTPLKQGAADHDEASGQPDTSGAKGGDEDAGYGFFAPLSGDESQSGDGTEASDRERGYGFFTEPGGESGAAGEEAAAAPDSAAGGGDGYGFFVDEQSLPARRESTTVVAETPPAATRKPAAAPPPAAGTAASTAGKRPQGRPGGASGDNSIRVSVEKVDQLINLVGELVITQAMLAQTASTRLDPDVYEILQVALSQLEHNTRDLQESVMSIRMMPISFVFSRFPRVVRDLCAKLDKQVELRTVGEGTELDKGLIEKLADPLTHLVRNSLDHGIESPAERLALGKPEKGTITLQAAHLGGNIVIEVIDDGAGLDRDRILAKARERGMNVSDNMSDTEVWQLIFEPGFSTAAQVTDVSGRGVGMDVVKKNIIQGMGGRIEIESHKGAGTRIIISLPLTLAILDGMSIRVGEEIFIVPLTFIVESLKPAPSDIKTVSGRGRVLHVRGEYVTLTALRDVFNIQSDIVDPVDGILVLVEAEGRKIAMCVDELVGQHQVVIKSLETNFRKVPGISGATIMGDGKVALILDVSSLVRISQT